jgi:hypothetical protein
MAILGSQRALYAGIIKRLAWNIPKSSSLQRSLPFCQRISDSRRFYSTVNHYDDHDKPFEETDALDEDSTEQKSSMRHLKD